MTPLTLNVRMTLSILRKNKTKITIFLFFVLGFNNLVYRIIRIKSAKKIKNFSFTDNLNFKNLFFYSMVLTISFIRIVTTIDVQKLILFLSPLAISVQFISTENVCGEKN